MLKEQEKGTPEGQEDVVFVNTALIWRAMEQVQRSQEDFKALLEQAQVDPAVAYDVGLRYAQGDGVETDLVQAVHWFAIGVESGDLRAMESLGRCYQAGDGVETDPVRGAELFRQAAEEGYPPAICDLGLCYEWGDGVEADPAQAAELYHQAGEEGYAPAQCNLGVCYLNGIGVEKDEVQAAEQIGRASCRERVYVLV